MALNFNVGPYFDDFDPSKNFHRILFKPGVAVQGRELTQSQTILQNQISNFASAIYSQNTPISGGQVTVNQNCYFLKLNPNDPNNAAVTAANFLGQIIQSADGTVVARVIQTAESTSSGSTAGDPPTLIITYLSGQQFTDGSFIATATGQTLYEATVITSTANNPSTGYSSTASIANGVFYIVNGYSISDTTGIQYSIGNFVQVNPQTIILDKYDNTPNVRIGLQITETIYDYVDDSSLLDPAIGASNFQAPGADRYVVSPSLVTLPLTVGNDQDFIELVRIENGNIVKQVDGTVYSTIDDYFAKRDYETNGDYIVYDFKLTPSANAQGVSSEYDLSVGKGVAYVHGYRVENQAQIVLTNQRAQATANINNNSVFVDYGNYFVVDTANGVFDISTLPQVDFHCVDSANVSQTTATNYNSTLVGSGFMRNLTYVSGTGSNTKSYIYNAYVNDITTNTLSATGTSGSTNTIVVTDSAGEFSALANAYLNVPISVTTGVITDTRNITNYQVSGSTKTFTVDKPFTTTAVSGSTLTLLFQNYNTNAIVKREPSSYILAANCNINVAGGKVNGLPQSTSILQNPGTPELIFPVGYPYVAQISNSSYYSQRTYRAKSFTGTTLTLYATSNNTGSPIRFEGSGTLSGASAEQLFIVVDTVTGAILDFTTTGNTITISSDKTSATLYRAAGYTNPVTIIASVQIQSGDSSNFVLKSKHLITGNTSTVSTSLTNVSGTGVYQDLSKGQVIIPKSAITTSKMSLYVNDVKNIVKIIDSGVAGTNPTGALSGYTDITNYFTLDNGQRDSYYDHAGITLVPGAAQPIGNILVVFNYYSHTQDSSGDGYFSIQSYSAATSTFGGVSTSPESYAQIPTYVAKDGQSYKLSDSLDFRPARQNGQTAYAWEYSGTQTSTNDIGVLIPSNLSNFISFYQYYLARQDKLVLTKDNNFQIIQGTPAVTPVLPVEPSGSLVLANLFHDPYTAYVPGEAPAGITPNLSIDKILHKRWAKSDITDIETRINNLEYYTSLSILEQNAQSLQVPDVNGLNRFKNGILVDNFSTYATADTTNPDFAANINVRTNTLGPVKLVNNFQLQNPVVLASLGTLGSVGSYDVKSISGTQTNVYTLPYTSEDAIVQQLASSTVSVNPFAVSIQQGIAQLNPPMDNWVDVNQAPAILVTDPTTEIYQQTNGLNYLNAGDPQTIPGTAYTTVTASGSTSTTTSTYASQLQNTQASAYNPVATTFNVNNGYLTNVGVLPYIRPQQIIVRVRGLLTNTPLHTFFDGQDVSAYMTAPNTIELVNVSGTFEQDDVVGFTVSNTFYPVARVISVYEYPNGTQVRLYVADIVNAPGSVDSTLLQNAKFNSSGNYITGSSSASGTINGASNPNSIVNLAQSGDVSGVGGGYANVLSGSTTTQFYSTPITQGYSDFLNTYGIWGDPNNSTTYNATFPVNLVAGTYTVYAAASGSAGITVNGSLIGTVTTTGKTQVGTYSASGGVVNIGWNATSSGTTQSAIAVTFVDVNGNVVFASTNPPNMTYLNAGTEVIMPGGGSFFENANYIRLDPATASNVANYYEGTQISITSQYVYTVNVAATYVPPPPAPSGGGGSIGGGLLNTLTGGLFGSKKNCCVVATALTADGDWSNKQYSRINAWAVKSLDKNFFGERLHRGYHMIAPKVIIPMMKSNGVLKGYVKWSFTNATNMLMGKKYDKLSIVNSIPWLTAMLVVGMFTSKESAEKSWKKLYK
jgi:hypothetical protein